MYNQPATSTYQPPVQPISLVDPYVYQTLLTVKGKSIVVDTVRGSIRGTLAEVQPDHIVLQEPKGTSTFFVRIAQIVWVMPET
ncbi:YuzF family protein [Marinicrinis sediminis]|uniref:YuzF family protein n=1 Tax=Marinicrinis sediminis TaxID=1652465 RepID=A0ABW5R740_9BACL